jgi:CheY-like chemotaxis protein
MYTIFKSEVEVKQLKLSFNNPLSAKEVFITTDGKIVEESAGSGLFITNAYVEMQGGKIWAKSQEGIGSTLNFTLACNADPIKETVIQHLSTSIKTDETKRLKILIAEDDEVSELLIDTIVKMIGKEILKVETGVEAVEVCRENPDIDLVLMDIQLPELNGYEATRQIRKFNKGVVIIAQTAYGFSGDREEATEAGCNDYMAKPIIKDELLSLIQKYFKT